MLLNTWTHSTGTFEAHCRSDGKIQLSESACDINLSLSRTEARNLCDALEVALAQPVKVAA